MPDISSFNDFVKATGNRVVTSPDKIVNDATLNTYLIGRMLKGRDASMSVQGGAKIIDRVQLSDSGTATFYLPNEDLDIQNVDTLTNIQIDWRFLTDHYAYTEEEIDLNSGNPQTYYKNLLKSKRQACHTSLYNKMEAALFAAGSNSGMETSSGRIPYSIPALVTPDGLAPSGFTTVQTINPTTEANWRNQVQTYDPGNKEDREDGIVNAMDKMWLKVRFEAPETLQQYAENDRLNKMCIITNLDGYTQLSSLTRESNDRLVPANNLGWVMGNITYAGMPIKYISTLDTALINSGSTIAEGAPWYYFLNLMYMYPIFHQARYMDEKEPMNRDRQPFSWVVWKKLYYNLFMASRRRQGIVVPNNL